MFFVVPAVSRKELFMVIPYPGIMSSSFSSSISLGEYELVRLNCNIISKQKLYNPVINFKQNFVVIHFIIYMDNT